jgi:hypothetical protein
MLSPTLFLPYLLIALVVTAVAARRARTPSRKRWITVGLLAFFIVFAYIDDILGGIQHKWLCHKEAGFFVYKPAKLPPEMYDASGKPKFITGQGPNEEVLKPYLKFEWTNNREYRQLFLKIDKRFYRVINQQTGEVLAEHVTFSAWPSEFIPTFSHQSATGCFDSSESLSKWTKWEAALFEPK